MDYVAESEIGEKSGLDLPIGHNLFTTLQVALRVIQMLPQGIIGTPEKGGLGEWTIGHDLFTTLQVALRVIQMLPQGIIGTPEKGRLGEWTIGHDLFTTLQVAVSESSKCYHRVS